MIKIDEIIWSRRKTIGLIITPEARLVIRAPFHTPEAYLREVVERKSRWIMAKKELVLNRKQEPRQFRSGEVFLFRGKPYILKTGGPEIRIEENNLMVPVLLLNSGALMKWYKEESRSVIRERCPFWAEKLGYSYSSLRISGARRRWGSCGPRNSINISWRLIMAPPEVLDSVIIHELVHTVVKDHSSRFWERVYAHMPDYDKWKAWLKEKAFLLDL